jgi:SAM-dependent methyltransferase
MKAKDRVQWVYSSKTNQELQERYDQWAEAYDQDLESEFGWIGPQYAVEVFSKYVSPQARILDAGAGTGLIGALLFEKGYRELAGMDLSEGMLAQANKKNVYKELHRMVMGEPLDFPSDSFDAVISVGALTEGHAPASSLVELVRITKPGGYVIYTLRTDLYEPAGFKAQNDALVQEGKWVFVERGKEIQGLPKGEPDVYLQAWVHRVV